MELETLRHSLAHILAYAVQALYPEVKFGMGPAIEQGFYYDFDFSEQRTKNNEQFKLTPENLPEIEKKMRELIKKNLKFVKKNIPKKEAKEIFKNQPYKLELIEEFPEKEVTIYQSGEFIDLCQGPHVKSTLQLSSGQGKEVIDAFKLTKIAGAYWRGSEKNPMLARIYGVAFKTKKELENYLKIQEETEKRDHRVLGKKLDLFSISEEVGAGLVIFHPKGAIVRGIIEDFWKKVHQKRGYQYVYSPHIGKLDLWKRSGHWDFYRENLYSPIEIENIKYLLKPMNCPFHIQVYKSQLRSYKDLPLRYCELGTVYRYEKAGVLHGLLRVRGFTQDDAHIFCTPEQLNEELKKILDLACFMLKSFGFSNYEIDLSVREPKNKEKYLGDEKNWKKAENALEYALKQKKLKYRRAQGEAVFYGPKIDIKLIDNLGRGWQGPTVQVDFNFPEKFDLTYIDKKGKKRQVVMVHRTVLGAMERFIGNLLEHYGGALPLWLAPEQIWVIPVGSRHKKYAREVNLQLTTYNLRTKIKDGNETVSKKIREGEIQKIPYLLVVGDKEMNPVRGSKGKQKTQRKQTSNGVKAKSVRVRQRGKGDVGEIKLEKFLEKIEKEIIIR